MNKLYWIVCEESDRTLYEGRFLGRTRGAALKHLKEQIGRSSLTGLVFAITEIPVPLIREIVAEILAGNSSVTPLAETRPPAPAETSSPERYEPFRGNGSANGGEAEAEADDRPPQGTRGPRAFHDWAAIKACYMRGLGPKDVAQIMEVPYNTLKKKITRERWAQERRGA